MGDLLAGKSSLTNHLVVSRTYGWTDGRMLVDACLDSQTHVDTDNESFSYINGCVACTLDTALFPCPDTYMPTQHTQTKHTGIPCVHTKTAKPIKVLFGMWTLAGPTNHV